MSQVRTGTVDVTNGSQVVTGSGTNWLTSTKINDLFIIQGESVIYRIASVASDTQISLSSNYVGTTAAGVAYVIHVDFTSSGIPLMQDGDIETVSIYNLAVVALEQGLAFGTYYLGAFSVAPTETGTGGAITEGMMYFDTSTDLLNVYDGFVWYDGAASAIAAAQSAAEAAADAVQTGLDRVQTGLDRVQTVSDAAQTISDAAQTAADRVQTGLDRVQTVSDAAQTVLDAAATAADRVQTGLDATATAADRVDVNDVETRVLAIEVSINNTFDTFDDRFLGTFAVDPTHDNDGNPISVGAVYYNSVELATKFYNGSSWDDPSQSASTSATNALNSENAAAASALDASTSASEALASEGAASTSESNAASSAADALASFNEFVDIYHGALSSAPTTNLDAGDLYFDIPTSAMRVYDGALWRAVTTVVEGVYAVAEYTNIATQTTITTAYDVGLVQVLYNGVQLNLGDFTATNSTSIVLAVAVASASDVITVIRWGAVTTSTFLGTAATVNTGVTTGTLPFAEDVVLIQPSGNVGIGIAPAAKKLTVFGTGVGNATVQIEGEGGADPYINFLTNNTQHWSMGVDDSDADKFKLSEHSALGTNDYLTVDVTGNCGIGTNSPAFKLDVAGNARASYFALRTNEAVPAESAFMYRPSTGVLGFGVTSAEKMRLDSSGNLLVGTTDAAVGVGNTNTGHSIGAAGYVTHSRTSGVPLFVNRNTNDGNLITLNKSGVEVGNIGTNGTHTYITGNDSVAGNGSGFLLGLNAATPVNRLGSPYDGIMNLGSAGARFRDLHLSGGVVFGTPSGAATSNTLDDYEEGTFSPVFLGSVTNPTVAYNTAYGSYTKVGNIVYVEIRLVTNSVSGGSGDLLIGNLPFTASGGPTSAGLAVAFVYNYATNPKTFSVNAGTVVNIYENDNTNTIADVGDLNTSPGNYTNLSGTYEVA
ncbi:hypothetical protein OAA60_00920 [Porticoccaceae bacterium]|nr:hypothetical protein [Porticoccaceae bacterium]